MLACVCVFIYILVCVCAPKKKSTLVCIKRISASSHNYHNLGLRRRHHHYHHDVDGHVVKIVRLSLGLYSKTFVCSLSVPHTCDVDWAQYEVEVHVSHVTIPRDGAS